MRAPASPAGYREVLRVAWPLMINTGSFTVMLFADRIFLSWYSSEAIRAALPAGILCFSLTSGFMAIAAFTNVFVAQYFGAGDRAGCSRATAQGIWFSLLCWPLLLALIPAGKWFLRLAAHPPEVLVLEEQYLTIILWGGITTLLGAAVGGFFTGLGRTRVTMATNVLGNACNLVLDYGLIFGKWGLPEMGIRGAAIGTVVAHAISPALLLALYFGRRCRDSYATHRHWRLDRALFARLLRFGFPSGVHIALDVSAFTVFVMLTGAYPPAQHAASNIAISINSLAFMPLIGLGIAASTLVGQYQGRRRADLARRSARNAFRLGFFYMCACAALFLLLPETLFAAFTARSDMALEEILPVGRRLLWVMAAWGQADNASLVLGSALKGAGDTRFVMICSLLAAWGLLVPGQLLLVRVWQAPLLLSWIWTALFIALLGSAFWLRYRGRNWLMIDLLGRGTPLPPGDPLPNPTLLIADPPRSGG
ncbi:MAG: MATE family efflux transporter [Candidatus Marinimicrobia bacterium]|nr:MATE family efflux transporter [Candidatus Neomarinimicrobiota bacterium]